jgi:hypothetical protein
MKASETKLIRVIEGTNQYLVPHFQRPYTWQRKNWETLWTDIAALVAPVESAATPEHFMGAIVTAPAHSVPEGVTKYLLIDGQQRLTTLLILLAAIRDRARQLEDEKLANKLHELYLTNRYQDGVDQYKLLPTRGDEPNNSDRGAFVAIIDAQELASPAGGLHAAHQYFVRQLKNHASEDLATLANAILGHVFPVSIVLERDDNPCAIFESLNAKGQPLSQSDLVRNFFFMSIDSARHDDIYSRKWLPMEKAVSRENMEAYVRHFLIRRGTVVKESEVYFTLKREVEERGRDSAEETLDDLVRVAKHYERFLYPEREPESRVRERLLRLQRLRATVCYPFLLNLFEDRTRGSIGESEVEDILDVIENFIVRRYVCGTIRAELNELFTALCRNASRFSKLSEGVQEVLGSRNYPLDQEFFDSLQLRKLYGAGEVKERARLILERLEAASGKEHVATGDLTIEHIMPQTLTDWWRAHLGPSAQETHDLYLHTIGNLTLTGYNSELSNADFSRKVALFQHSRLGLNAELTSLPRWTREEIESRARGLADRALQVWPNFAPHAAARRVLTVRGTTPRQLLVLDQVFDVQSWQDVLRITLTQIAGLGPDIVQQLAQEFPRLVRTGEGGLRSPRPLAEGAYYESHLNADQIHKICFQVAQQVGLSASEWRVDTTPVDGV